MDEEVYGTGQSVYVTGTEDEYVRNSCMSKRNNKQTRKQLSSLITNGGRSAYKFHKSANFADSIFFRFADLPQMWEFAILQFAIAE